MSKSRFSTDGLNFPAPKPSATQAADDNYSDAWAETIGKLGFYVVCIQMRRSPKAFESNEFPEWLGEKMNSAGLGHYDSSEWQPHVRHFFYANTKRLREVLTLLKSSLEDRGLMNISAVGHYSATEKIWRTFDPGIEK